MKKGSKSGPTFWPIFGPQKQPIWLVEMAIFGSKNDPKMALFLVRSQDPDFGPILGRTENGPFFGSFWGPLFERSWPEPVRPKAEYSAFRPFGPPEPAQKVVQNGPQKWSKKGSFWGPRSPQMTPF